MATLWEIKDREVGLSHMEGHKVRMAWIERVLECCRADDFKFLIGDQLELYCDYPRLDELMEACNTPKHLVRNRLITFEIDHPNRCEKCMPKRKSGAPCAVPMDNQRTWIAPRSLNAVNRYP